MIGTLTTEQIDELVLTQSFARLGCHAEGETYIVPISYALDGGRLVAQTTPGKKLDMMRLNPKVCVQIDHVASLTSWRSVVLQGLFRELEGVAAASAMGLLIDKYGPIFQEQSGGLRRGREMTPPRLDGAAAPLVVYAIEIVQRSGRFEGQ